MALYSDWKLGDYTSTVEAIGGEIDLANVSKARSLGWYGQIGRMFGERFEGVARVASLDTDGYGGRLSTLIRKAPNSGLQYDRIDSLYLGLNYYVKGNDIKLSAGYELGEGRNPVRALAERSSAKETVTGLSLRGQLQF